MTDAVVPPGEVATGLDAVAVLGNPSAVSVDMLATGSLTPKTSNIAATRSAVHTDARDLPRWNQENNSCGRSPSSTSTPLGIIAFDGLSNVTTVPLNGTTTTSAETNRFAPVTASVIDFSENIAERA
nr:hypothetical protein [Nocardia veterana]